MTENRSSTGGKGQPSTANTGTADLNQLAEDFGDLARSLEAHDDPEVMLAEIVAAAVAMVPGDSVTDIQVSLTTGIRCIGSAKTAARGRDLQTAGADAVTDSIAALANLIRQGR